MCPALRGAPVAVPGHAMRGGAWRPRDRSASGAALGGMLYHQCHDLYATLQQAKKSCQGGSGEAPAAHCSVSAPLCVALLQELGVKGGLRYSPEGVLAPALRAVRLQEGGNR